MDRPNRDAVLVRVLFLLLLSALAAVVRPLNLSTMGSAAAGVLIALAAIIIEARLRRAALTSLIGASLGLFSGGLLGVLFACLLTPASLPGNTTASFVRLALPIVAGYIGLLVGLSKADRLNLNAVGLLEDRGATSPSKILDTSVLIDGRIADIAESGFLDGDLLVPQFVLHELQLVADSADSSKRNRGRRGLDVVQQLQKIARIHLKVSDQDFPQTREVDLKLIELAKHRRAKIVTNDFNLNKLAQVQGVEVLNINELANALKPVVLPGETMRVFVHKEGKEHNQGVAYLDDGTMVVIDNARRQLSKTVDITVTTVLQTTAGKMIFAKYDERSEPRSMSASDASAGSR